MKSYCKISESELLNKILHSSTLKQIGFRLDRSVTQEEFNSYWNVDIKRILLNNNIILKMIEDLNHQNEELECAFCGKSFLRHTRDKSNKSNTYFCSDLCSKRYSSSYGNTVEKRQSKSVKLKELFKVGKISIPSKLDYNTLSNNKDEYNKNPKKCPICGSNIKYENKNHKTCSIECGRKLSAIHNHETQVIRHSSGGYRKGSGRGHKGWYKGYYCDSTYELALVIFCLDHNIEIIRNTKGYPYQWNGSIHYYYPDWIIGDHYIETKNYISDHVQAKISSVYDKSVVILMYDDLIGIFDYVAQTYGKTYTKSSNNFYELYEKK